MKIKTRLSLYFTLISSGALLIVLVVIYFVVFSFFRADFIERLTDRTNVASQLYLKADEIDADSMLQVQQRYLEKLPDEVIRIYNKNNRIAFNTHNNVFWTSSIIDQVRRDGYIEYQEGERQVVGKLYKDNQGDFVILASAIDKSFSRRAMMLGKTAVLLFLIFMLISFFAGQIFAKNALAPIKKIIDQMRQIRSSNLHLRVDGVKNKDEIADLISNFNSLLEHLENAFELQQTFVSNASHELRTPVTSIMGEVDVALSKERSSTEYKRVLQSISADAFRLQETITSLMELAQVDFNYTQATLSPVRIDELIWELEEHWSARQGPGMLNLKFADLPEDENELIIFANKPLLYIAINNIIDNAFKYSGTQPVDIYFEAGISQIKITITDKGPGIKAADTGKIFQSFYRSASVKNIPGSGVGLYIASKIIQLCKGKVAVVSDGEAGSTFIIEFAK
ncbi:HAMP domain-containing sensor histidine kinase [Mucilaginibacter gynuensis]|uniref:histidine kinase n=1 Tax=Mucilaginibacter gynuensis TaxID=1302236 RepID=A0ABP8H842_9SPHI